MRDCGKRTTCRSDKEYGKAGPELRVFGDGEYMTTKAGRELGGGRFGTSDVGRRLQAAWVIGKILSGVTGTILIVVTRLAEMDVDDAFVGEGGGGELKEGGYGKVTYVGGSRKRIVVKEGMGLEEIRRMLRGGVDVRIVFKGNNEHGYSYVNGIDRLKRRAQKAGAER
ncbi:hypothetical protein Cgig2_025679 [Carnegiea gigantea]|uniref:Uncharacterized protein n=1 Tax=Carnegiea gigantea TaxID=171969 RepID=A0A9Q1JUA2_9CARY|nr:hypothetical protein Cgig2_025679 [Carnegiea gigantea]